MLTFLLSTFKLAFEPANSCKKVSLKSNRDGSISINTNPHPLTKKRDRRSQEENFSTLPAVYSCSSPTAYALCLMPYALWQKYFIS